MKRSNKNVRIIIESRKGSGFDIYLDFSGQREYLMTHRHNGLLYMLLKDGMFIEDIRRWRVSREKAIGGNKRTNVVDNSMKHILLVAEDYLAERQAV